MPCPLMDWVAANSSSHRLLSADMGSKGPFNKKATLSGGFFVATRAFIALQAGCRP